MITLEILIIVHYLCIKLKFVMHQEVYFSKRTFNSIKRFKNKVLNNDKIIQKWTDLSKELNLKIISNLLRNPVTCKSYFSLILNEPPKI